MGKRMLLAMAGVAMVVMVAVADPAPATPAQYRPDPIPTTTELGVAAADEGRGARRADGELAVTGGDSASMAAKGLALVLAGVGALILRRTYRLRS